MESDFMIRVDRILAEFAEAIRLDEFLGLLDRHRVTYFGDAHNVRT